MLLGQGRMTKKGRQDRIRRGLVGGRKAGMAREREGFLSSSGESPSRGPAGPSIHCELLILSLVLHQAVGETGGHPDIRVAAA